MKPKKEYLLLTGVIAALVLYLFLRQTDRTHYELPDLEPLTASEITSVSITGKDNTMELRQDSGKWLIQPGKYPAEPARVDPMIDAINNLKVTALVSGSDNYQRYHLDAENRIRVQAGSNGTVMRAFDIGKTAPSSRHTFIKLQGDPNVYHAPGNFRSQFEKSVEEMRDKTVLAFDSGEIMEIEITMDGKTRRFAQKAASAGSDGDPADEPAQMAWQDETGARADEPAIRELLEAAADLKCRQFVDDQTKDDFKDPIYVLKLHAGEDKVYSLFIFAKPDEDAIGYPAVSSGSDHPFLLPSGKADAMMTPLMPNTQPEQDA